MFGPPFPKLTELVHPYTLTCAAFTGTAFCVNSCRLYSESVLGAAQSGTRGPVAQPSDATFLARAFEESLLPAILVCVHTQTV